MQWFGELLFECTRCTYSCSSTFAYNVCSREHIESVYTFLFYVHPVYHFMRLTTIHLEKREARVTAKTIGMGAGVCFVVLIAVFVLMC